MSALRDAIKQLDPAPDQSKQITLLLTMLSELCEQKVANFTDSITSDLLTAGTQQNKSIPITQILSKYTDYRAYVSNNAKTLQNEVMTAVKNFISGGDDNIVSGIGSLVTAGINAILGGGTGSQTEMSSYYIVVEAYAIARYDVRAWSRHIEAQGITTEIEDAMAIVAFKSSVDVSKISFNTFLLAYGQQLAMMKFTGQQQADAITSAQKIFNMLRTADQPSSNAPAITQSADMTSPGHHTLSRGGLIRPTGAVSPGSFISPGILILN